MRKQRAKRRRAKTVNKRKFSRKRGVNLIKGHEHQAESRQSITVAGDGGERSGKLYSALQDSQGRRYKVIQPVGVHTSSRRTKYNQNTTDPIVEAKYQLIPTPLARDNAWHRAKERQGVKSYSTPRILPWAPTVIPRTNI